MSKTTVARPPTRYQAIPCSELSDATQPVDLSALESAQRVNLGQLPQLDRNVQRWQTEAGSRVSFVESRELAIIDVVLRFSAGSTLDGDQPGLAATTLYMLDQGTEQHDAQGFASAMEDLGAQLHKQIRLDHATLSLRCLSDPEVYTKALQLLTDLLARPRFDAVALGKIKSRLLSHLALLDGNVSSILQRAVLSHLFSDHPYGHYVNGTPDGVKALTVDDLRSFHQRAYSANNVDIAIVGDLSAEQARALSKALSDALNQGWAASELAPPPDQEATRQELSFANAGTRAMLTMPLHITPQDPDYPAILLGCEILGAGVNSRLMTELRSRRGLTYDINAALTQLRAGGALTIEWDIAPQHAEASRRVVMAVVRCFMERGPSAAEVELALNQMAGALLLKVARNDQIAWLLAEHSHGGLPANHLTRHLERLAAVTPEQVREALQRWFDLVRMSFFSVGPRTAQDHLPELTDQ